MPFPKPNAPRRIPNKPKATRGITLVEMIIALSIVGILAASAVPAFSLLVPDYRLKRAARDILSHLQFAKVESVKENRRFALIFDPAGTGGFRMLDYGPNGTFGGGDDALVREISLFAYDEKGSVKFGGGSATHNATLSMGPLPEDGISYTANRTTFNGRGTSKNGYVYIENQEGHAFAIGTRTTGKLIMKKWNAATEQWE
jgi:prepilin-type N-terminal cleavage/methylation domain-containing protein